MNNEEKLPVEQLVESTNLTNQFVILFMLLSCGAFVEGYVNISSILVSPLVEKQFGVSSSLRGFFISAYFAGLIVSAFLANLINRKGRKPALITANLLCLAGSGLVFFAYNIFFMAASNFFVGVGIGSLIITGTSLASEVCSRPYRTFAFTWIWLFFPVGEIMSCFLSDYFSVFKPGSSDWSKILSVYPLLVVL